VSLSAETRAAVEKQRREHGGSYRLALAIVMGRRKADEWNAKWPVGTKCVVELYKGGTRYNTATRSAAWILGHGGASVQIDGRAGSYGLEWLTPGGHVDGLATLEWP
jgi:hypothetical protein